MTALAGRVALLTGDWERDSAALVVAINDLTAKIGDFNAAFLEQGMKDLR